MAQICYNIKPKFDSIYSYKYSENRFTIKYYHFDAFIIAKHFNISISQWISKQYSLKLATIVTIKGYI